jgi:hypothetical protein
LHARSLGCQQTQVCVFEDDALFWRHAEAAGCLKKRVWVWLVAGGVFGSDNRIEEVIDANGGQGVRHDLSLSPTCDRHR